MTHDMESSKKLLEKISAPDIVQTKKIFFTFKNISLWTMFSFSIFIGSLAFSVIIYTLSQTDFDILSHLTHSKIEFFLGLLPVFWLLSLLIFLAISIFIIKYTKTGYRYSLTAMFLANLAISAAFGSIFYYSKGAQTIDNIFAKNIPTYHSVEENKVSTWSMPENGLLSGKIINATSTVTILDWQGNTWEVMTGNALIRGRVNLQVGQEIKIIGNITGTGIFTADEIRPWNGQGKH